MGRGETASSRRVAERKDFQHPDETRAFEKGKVELVTLGGAVVGRLTLEPGWRWSQHLGPIAKTKWCNAPHFYYQLTGRLHIHTAAGDELESCADDVTALRTAHDAWVIGDEAVVLIDWSGAADFAREAPIQPSVGPRDSRGGVVTTQE